MFDWIRNRAALAPLVLAAVLAACGPRDPSSVVVAYIDERPVMLWELEQYFEINLPDGGPPDAESANRVKSRLFDALVRERTLAAEAQRRGFEVGEIEVDAQLDRRSETPGPSNAPRSLRTLVRRRLMVQELEEAMSRNLDPPSEEEVRAYVEAHRERLAPPLRVTFRALLFESKATADAVYEAIRTRKMSFAEAVLAHEPHPGQAGPRELSWQGLPETVRDAMQGLQPGEVSPALVYNGEVYLFQVQSLPEATEPSEERLHRLARAELQRERSRDASAALVGSLLARARIKIQARHLPFDYVQQDPR